MSDRQQFDVLRVVTEEHRPRAADGRDLLARARWLDEDQQMLLTLALSGQHTYRQLGALLGANPGVLCRRVRALKLRLLNPLVVELIERPLGLADHFRQIGLDRHLRGRSIRAIADAHGLTEPEIKAALGFLEGWLRMSRQGGVERRRCTVAPPPVHRPKECKSFPDNH